jgi:1-deoxy-D-xylulose-5-phosphate reductoisomerase
MDADIVLNAIAGAAGLKATLATLSAGNKLALANKESLIIGGDLVKDLSFPGQIIPVDSEHSAIAQCLLAGKRSEVRKLIITASGGPFRGKSASELEQVSIDDALAHPTWKMGPLVTINSATLVNKGLEVIEAHLLFDIPFTNIEVTVHPQSVVHSMVEFVDGSTIAQASPPDMRIPIAWGLSAGRELFRVAVYAKTLQYVGSHGIIQCCPCSTRRSGSSCRSSVQVARRA